MRIFRPPGPTEANVIPVATKLPERPWDFWPGWERFDYVGMSDEAPANPPLLFPSSEDIPGKWR